MMYNLLKQISLLAIMTLLVSCTETDEEECETETVCFSDGSCIEQPVNFSDCF